MKRLSELKIGDTAEIVSITDSELGIRLMEMGLLPGEKIKVELIAPMGDPIAISISHYQLSIRKADAGHVLVK